jgi:hypothetical protein
MQHLRGHILRHSHTGKIFAPEKLLKVAFYRILFSYSIKTMLRLNVAKFLNTEGVSYHLSTLIDNSLETLILISPYLKINERIKSCLQDRDRLKRITRIIYGKSELQPTEINWVKSLEYTHTSFCKDLHAKCYLNENEAIVTSMNLHEYSQVNNYEMGIYIEKSQDSDLYKSVYEEVQKLIRNSDELKISVSKVNDSVANSKNSHVNSVNGFCIRCHSELALNPSVPYCKSCYSFWKIEKKDDQEEKYCHICGKLNKSTLLKPTCYSCYKSNKDKLEFPASK